MSTVKELKKLAQERGLRGYSKLRKAELLSLLEKSIPTSENIMDIRNPKINVPILVPEIVKVKPNIEKKLLKKPLKLSMTGEIGWLKVAKNILPNQYHLP